MKRKLFALSALAAASAPSFAALPSGVDTTITGAGTDVVAAVGLMIGVAVSIWAIKKVYNLFGR